VRSTSAPQRKPFGEVWVPRILWGVAVIMAVVMVFVVWQRALAVFAPELTGEPVPGELQVAEANPNINLPAYAPSNGGVLAVARSLNGHTVIPTRERSEAEEYTVEKGDSIFGIASQFDLKADTILWANYDILNDDPHSISIGQVLKIPPVDGVYHKWKEGDTIDKVASQYHTTPEKILNYPGNRLDLTNPVIESDTFVMVPDGWREYKQWVIPTIWRANAGASKTIAGGCAVPEGGAVGTGFFTWPAANHYLSGNDYFDGHLGIDVAAGTGAPIYAADSGVVVYAAPIGGGYGNMVMIDHGNGYHTLYAHLDSIAVGCGQSVFQGNIIGYAGSTGNSTGPHLHFEIRYFGGFINPWQVLP